MHFIECKFTVHWQKETTNNNETTLVEVALWGGQSSLPATYSGAPVLIPSLWPSKPNCSDCSQPLPTLALTLPGCRWMASGLLPAWAHLDCHRGQPSIRGQSSIYHSKEMREGGIRIFEQLTHMFFSSSNTQHDTHKVLFKLTPSYFLQPSEYFESFTVQHSCMYFSLLLHICGSLWYCLFGKLCILPLCLPNITRFKKIGYGELVTVGCLLSINR